MENQNYIDLSWSFTSNTKIIHKWDQIPYYAQGTLVWRGQKIDLKIEEFRIDAGMKRIISFRYKNRNYQYGAAKWKWSGGHFGSPLPEIKSETHFLKIHSGMHFLSFEDNAINPEMNPEKEELIFEFRNTTEVIRFEPPAEKKAPYFNPKTNEITLCDFKDASVAFDIFACFLDGRLIVDYWRLGSSTEDEYQLIVSGEHLERLFQEFKIENQDQAKLLIGLGNSFSGKDCYNRIKEFLTYKQIEFSQLACR
jgi:hypothetical protein